MEFQQIAGMVNCEQPIRRSLPLSQKCTVHKKISRAHSVSVSALQCVTGVCRLVYVHFVSTGSHMYVGLSFNLVQYSQVYIGVP